MAEIRNQREVFDGGERRKKGEDRRRAKRRKSDIFMMIVKYLGVALLAALLVKYLG